MKSSTWLMMLVFLVPLLIGGSSNGDTPPGAGQYILNSPPRSALDQDKTVDNLNTLLQWGGSPAYYYYLLDLPKPLDLRSLYVANYNNMVSHSFEARPYPVTSQNACIKMTVPTELVQLPQQGGMCVTLDGFGTAVPVDAARIMSANFAVGFVARLVLGEYVESWHKAGVSISQGDLDFGINEHPIAIPDTFTKAESYKFYILPMSFPAFHGPVPDVYPDKSFPVILPVSSLPFPLDAQPSTPNPGMPPVVPPSGVPWSGFQVQTLTIVPNPSHPQVPNAAAYQNLLTPVWSLENGLANQLQGNSLQAAGILWGWRAASELEGMRPVTGNIKYLLAAQRIVSSRFTAEEMGEITSYALTYLTGYTKMVAAKNLPRSGIPGMLQSPMILQALANDPSANSYAQLSLLFQKVLLAECLAIANNKKLDSGSKNRLLAAEAAFIRGYQAGCTKTSNRLFDEMFALGYGLGVKDGFDTGFAQGYASGYRDGYANGYANAWVEANKVIDNLQNQLAKATSASDGGDSQIGNWLKTAENVAQVAGTVIGIIDALSG